MTSSWQHNKPNHSTYFMRLTTALFVNGKGLFWGSCFHRFMVYVSSLISKSYKSQLDSASEIEMLKYPTRQIVFAFASVKSNLKGYFHFWYKWHGSLAASRLGILIALRCCQWQNFVKILFRCRRRKNPWCYDKFIRLLFTPKERWDLAKYRRSVPKQITEMIRGVIEKCQ